MKQKSILISFLALLYVATGCNRAENSATSGDTRNADDTTEMAGILTNDDCFEKKMERWFVKFNQLQDEGLNMEKAHHEAIASITLEFKDCNSNPAAIQGN